MQWQPQAQFAGFIMAYEKGFFRAAGLPTVQLLWSKLGDKPIHRLCAGEVEFATAWLATGLLRRIEGLDPVNIGQYMQKSATMMVARAGRGITKPEDLTGKVLLSWGGDFDSEFRMFLAAFAIKPKAVFPLSNSLAPMLQGAADASQAMYYNEYYSLLERGLRKKDLVEFHYADAGLNFVGDGLFTTSRYRDEHPDICAAVNAAVIKGWAYAFAHEEETLDTVLRYTKANSVVTNRGHQRWMLQVVKDLVTHGVGPDPADWGQLRRADYDFIVDALKSQGRDVSKLSYETLFRPVPVK
ncbi:MAG: ABC transporter substrate-binding protein [Deltaproteobacteria bacterium]|jgi:NitT/TauT family transport system substrate-binding protein|nr:ABC transporter substrate-binding protein [Deltaproteobacteria bacterium]